MKILITQDLDESLAGVYKVEAGKVYNTDELNSGVTLKDAEVLLAMGVATTDIGKRQLRNVLYKEKNYKKGDVVFKNNNIYKANKPTGGEFVRSEWDLIAGIEDHIDGISYSQDSLVFKNNKIYKSIGQSSTVFKSSEWTEKSK